MLTDGSVFFFLYIISVTIIQNLNLKNTEKSNRKNWVNQMSRLMYCLCSLPTRWYSPFFLSADPIHVGTLYCWIECLLMIYIYIGVGFICACTSALGSCVLGWQWPSGDRSERANNGGMQKWKGQRREASKWSYYMVYGRPYHILVALFHCRRRSIVQECMCHIYAHYSMAWNGLLLAPGIQILFADKKYDLFH